MEIPGPPSTGLGIVLGTTLLVIGIWNVLSKREVSQLIDAPHKIACPVDTAKADDEKTNRDVPEYDVVIIGGGTAGCVLANRLSENPKLRVLVLEAGKSSRDVQESIMPAALTKMWHTSVDYNLWTEPQVNAANAKKYWPRAKLLGGCSTNNAMIFHTCAPTDFDEWALSGQEGASSWAYRDFVKYLHKFEKYIQNPKFPAVDISLRGTNGPVQVGFWGHLLSTTTKWVQSCVNLGIPQSPDLNTSKGSLGVTNLMTYIYTNGERVTAERAYLTKDVLKRPNLKVAIRCRVTRILFQTKGNDKTAVGVEFMGEKSGLRYRVRVRREVVLSAGAIHSPHILMLSGIGPKKHLAEHGIPLVHDLPGVGQNLQDHAIISMDLRLKRGKSLSYLASGDKFSFTASFFRALAALVRWKLFRTGPLRTNLAEAAAFFRSDDTKLFLPDGYKIEDMSSGQNAPDLESIFLAVGFPALLAGFKSDVISLITILLRPQSSGTITLKSADPFDAPSIDPRYLSTQNDVACLVRGLKLNIRTGRTEPFASAVEDSNDLDNRIHNLSDAELENIVRQRVATLFHPTSTCRMARLNDGGVVDPYLRVYGIKNLRIADASIFPRIPSGHTTAPALAVGEKAADMMKQSLSSA